MFFKYCLCICYNIILFSCERLMFSKPEETHCNFKKFGIDPTNGFIFTQSYQPEVFDKSIIVNTFENLHEKIKNKQVSAFVENMPDIKLNLSNSEKDSFKERRDCLYLHGLLTIFINAYIVQKKQSGLQESEIIIPKNIGLPLYRISRFLKIKYGMCSQFYANWRLKNMPGGWHQLPQDIKVTDIQMIFRFTCSEKDQNIFFGGSLVGCFYLFKVICTLYQINQLIQSDPLNCKQAVQSSLCQVRQHIKKINISNSYILDNMTPDFLITKLRKYVQGYKNLKFDGVDELLSTDGGAGGFDPMYQIFQKMIGVQYIKGPLTKTQEVFRQGFPQEINNFIKQLEEKPLSIRQFCLQSESQLLKKAYNNVISQYAAFYVIHRQFIRKFITDQVPQATHGVGGVSLKDIESRAEAVEVNKI